MEVSFEREDRRLSDDAIFSIDFALRCHGILLSRNRRIRAKGMYLRGNTHSLSDLDPASSPMLEIEEKNDEDRQPTAA